MAVLIRRHKLAITLKAELSARRMDGSLIDVETVRMQRAREGAAIQAAVLGVAPSLAHELVGLTAEAIYERLDRWARETLSGLAARADEYADTGDGDGDGGDA